MEKNCTITGFLNCTPHYIVGVMKSRSMSWVGHMARIEKRGAYRVFVRTLEENELLRRLGVDGMIILKLASQERLGSMERVSGLSISRRMTETTSD